ncbi:hypothetical protein LOK49_LG03G02527 [Camellia lanceoleosa]|uniref:Uncharacterized protein n=1 Tax=Camellia lanceoleosa TaxID=1840588 RepID=A0ACC0I8T0_9ERIC|nr:hypothetical protein LOK49_LG03G02527 [Camellia lanceoleosa]
MKVAKLGGRCHGLVTNKRTTKQNRNIGVCFLLRFRNFEGQGRCPGLSSASLEIRDAGTELRGVFSGCS